MTSNMASLTSAGLSYALRWSASFWRWHGIRGREAYLMRQALLLHYHVRACPKHEELAKVRGGWVWDFSLSLWFDPLFLA